MGNVNISFSESEVDGMSKDELQELKEEYSGTYLVPALISEIERLKEKCGEEN